MRNVTSMTIRTDYNNIGKVLYILTNREIEQVSSNYTEVVELKVRFPAETVEELQKEITEATSGRTEFTIDGSEFAVVFGR